METFPAKWWPTGETRNLRLTKTMEGLASVKDKIQIFGGLALEPATAGTGWRG